jgi:DNA-binding PucR family transcriptional regulator
VSAYLVVAAAAPPSSNEQFLLQTLAQQTAVALANARLHARERATAEELVAAKQALEASMGALHRGIDIHQRLTQVAMAGEGQEGIAKALHEVTGYSVAIEDRYGNLRAWAGSDCPDPYPKDPPGRREQLIRRALGNPQPFRHEGRLLTLAQPREDVVGLLALIDPAGTAGDQELVALEHGGTVLAMELARLQSLAETELRLRRDLVEELLAGTDEDSARRRAQALGYDLERTHRVVIVEGRARNGDENLFFHAVRRAARDVGVGALLAVRASTVIILSDAERSWDQFRAAIAAELIGGGCRIGIGGRCERPSDFPRSYQQAQLALKMQRTSRDRDKVTIFDDLGVYQVLFEVQDPTMERFVRQWLGPLLDYDLKKGTELVATLAEYLEHGRNYDTTAAVLCVHRSTLKYRLQRIREVCGCDLRDPDTHFNLQLACRAWSTLHALREPLEDLVAEASFSRFRSGYSDCLS